jgi:hypothetical protein
MHAERDQPDSITALWPDGSLALMCISLNSTLRTGLAGSTYRTPIRGILSVIGILRQLRSGQALLWLLAITAHQDVTHVTDRTRSFVSSITNVPPHRRAGPRTVCTPPGARTVNVGPSSNLYSW